MGNLVNLVTISTNPLNLVDLVTISTNPLNLECQTLGINLLNLEDQLTLGINLLNLEDQLTLGISKLTKLALGLKHPYLELLQQRQGPETHRKLIMVDVPLTLKHNS